LKRRYASFHCAASPRFLRLGSDSYGATPRQAGLEGHVIQPKKLQVIAVKVLPAKRGGG